MNLLTGPPGPLASSPRTVATAARGEIPASALAETSARAPAPAPGPPVDTPAVLDDVRLETQQLTEARELSRERRNEGVTLASLGVATMIGAVATLSGPVLGVALAIGGVTAAVGATLAARGQRHARQAEQSQQSEDSSLQSVSLLARTLEARDPDTHAHCTRVSDLSRDFARWLGLPQDRVRDVAIGAYVHDLGKLQTPDAVLHKPGKLTPEERQRIEEHPAAGDDLLRDVPLEWNVHPAVRHHHERWDGKGYPDRLRREEIPLSARIVALADVWDALSSARSYKKEQGPAECLRIMQAEAGTHFDPDLAERFFQFLGEREGPRG